MAIDAPGSTETFDQRLISARGILRAFFSRRVGNRSDIDDLVQETLLSLHLARSRFDAARPFNPWALGVARNKLIDYLRRTARAHFTALDEERLSDPTFEHRMAASIDVARTLGRIPGFQAQAVRALRLEGYQVAEAAAKASVNASCFKVRAHRGLNAMRGLMCDTAASPQRA